MAGQLPLADLSCDAGVSAVDFPAATHHDKNNPWKTSSSNGVPIGG